MADAEGGATKGSRPEGGIRFSPGFLRSPGGLLILLNLVFLAVAWIIMAAEQDHLNFSTGRMEFFLFATVFSFIFWIIVLLFFLFNIVSKLTFINVPLTLVGNVIIDVVLLLIASSLVADQGRKVGRSSQKAAAAFGFFAMFGLCIQGFFHFRDRK